jgi:hypothetical protein
MAVLDKVSREIAGGLPVHARATEVWLMQGTTGGRQRTASRW